jgi:hypothetical protein
VRSLPTGTDTFLFTQATVGTHPGVDRRTAAQVLRRARAVSAAAGFARPPVRPERAAARCGIREIRQAPSGDEVARLILEPDGARILELDRDVPPHTPQWNALVALAAAQMLLPPRVSGAAAQEMSEIAAAELLLPARLFRPIAARTDLTLDGLRGLAHRFSATIGLTVRQWLQTGTWTGFALLWRQGPSGIRLSWRAASPGMVYPVTLAIGARAEDLWQDGARLRATLQSGRPHHGVEQVSTGGGTGWWFTRFGVVRDGGGRAALTLVILDRRDGIRTRAAEGTDSAPANRGPTAGPRSLDRRRRGARR